MNPIDFALRRPWTVVVGVVAITLLSLVALRRMKVDVFPSLDAPIVYVCQPYGGMDPVQMEGLLTNYYEYHFLYISGIHHVESRSVQGMAIMKLVFHPGTDMAQAMAETIGYVTRSRAFMPPGTVSPFITRFDGGSVPVGYLVLSSRTKSIGEIQDQALFKVRPMFASLPGVSAPPPFGGSQRTVVVRLDPDRIKALAMAPDEVIAALSHGNVISPSGVIRIGEEMPIVSVNALVRDVTELLDIPIRRDGGTIVFLRDVATVADSSDVPTGYALVDGRRAVYILVTKRADASTLDVVSNVRRAIPDMKAVLPDDIDVGFEFDQSPTVTRAIAGLVQEAAVGAGLVGLVVLLFLRDVRSALVVVLTIPFALAGAVVGLWGSGQSLNLMTLGGLALAVGIVVDEATVEIENIHAKLSGLADGGRPSVALAVRQGNMDTAVPRLLAMLCVVAVFLPSFFMEGTARALFVPLSLAVAFAMISSYILSSTFVPVAAAWLLRPHRAGEHGREAVGGLRGAFAAACGGIVALRWIVVPAALAGSVVVAWLAGRTLGLEIFPRVDAGRFQVRIEAPTGTRIEKTEEICRRVLEIVDAETSGEGGRTAIDISVGYAGLIPSSYPINAIYQWTGGPEEAVLRVAMRPEAGIDIRGLTARLRERLARELPDVGFSFEPADIVSEVMSFGSSTPVEVAVSGPNFEETKAHAGRIRTELAAVPTLRDVRFAQSLDYPAVRVTIDRRRAGASDVTAEAVARSLVAATSSSRFVVPNYWPDPKTGIGYQVQVEIPYQIMRSVEDIATLPVATPGGNDGSAAGGVLLRDVADVAMGSMPGQFDRYNMRRTVSLTANVAGEDLGRAAARVARAVAAAGEPPKGVKVDVRGQIAPLWEILRGLTIGLVASLLVILLLLTAAFQSLRLAVVAVATAPAVIAGVVLALRLSGTTVNLQSFMGAIMALGVSTANAILLVSFAERERREGRSAADAAVVAASARVRPILMTSLAMAIGMLPLAVGTGEGGEQTAPLGRAVIGGLVASTAATLLVLPGAFALVMGWASRGTASLHPFDPTSSRFVSGAGAAAAILAAVLLSAATGCADAEWGSGRIGGTLAPGAGEPVTATREAAAATVSAVVPERRTIRRACTQPGQVEPYEVTELHAKLSGFVKRVGVDIGDRVREGDLLVELSLPELEAERMQKTAAVEQAEAELKQAESQRKVAIADRESAVAKVTAAKAATARADADVERRRSELARVEKLVEEGAVTEALADESRSLLASAKATRDEIDAQVRFSESEVVQAEAGIEKAASDVEAARSRVEVAKADRVRTEAMLAYSRITAPFDGVVTSRRVHPGHLTGSGGIDEPLVTVAKTDRLRVVVAVPEIDAAHIDVGDPVEIRLQAVAGVVVEAAITRLSNSLSPQTRTLRAEIDLDAVQPAAGRKETLTLRPGLYATTTIVAEEHADAIVIPRTAVVKDDAGSSVFVIEGDVVRRRKVKTGLEEGPLVEIVEGLADSDRVVAAGAGSLADGQKVRVAAP